MTGKAAIAAVPVVSVLIVVWTTFLAPGEPAAGPVAQISEASAEPHVSLRDYLNAVPGKLAAFVSRAQSQNVTKAELKPVLDGRGVVATFTLDLKGPVGTTLNVTRTMFTATGDIRVREASTTVVPPPHYVLRSREERFVDDTWIANPDHGTGSYIVELVVLDGRGDVLAHSQTSAFSVSAG